MWLDHQTRFKMVHSSPNKWRNILSPSFKYERVWGVIATVPNSTLWTQVYATASTKLFDIYFCQLLRLTHASAVAILQWSAMGVLELASSAIDIQPWNTIVLQYIHYIPQKTERIKIPHQAKLAFVYVILYSRHHSLLQYARKEDVDIIIFISISYTPWYLDINDT